jgi:cell division protein FtsB
VHTPLLDRILPYAQAAVFALCMGLACFGDRGLQDHRALTDTLRATEAESAALVSSNATLLEQIHLLERDAATIERKAREELGMVRPGEQVYRFPAVVD